MSYYDYEPNYYDEYLQYSESDMAYEDPVYVNLQVSQHKRFARSKGSYSSSKSFITTTRDSLHNYYIVAQENLPCLEENQYIPHYVVPVMYAPSKGVCLTPHTPVKDRSLSYESIDRYFSDEKNLQSEASVYRKVIRRKQPRDVIREEPESLTSCSESVRVSEKERSDTKFRKRREIPRKRSKLKLECPKKSNVESRVKKKKFEAKDEESEITKATKISFVDEEIEERGKEEHTKKQQGEVTSEQDLVCQPPSNKSKEKPCRLPRRSHSTLEKKVFLSHVSHMPISCIPSTSNTEKIPRRSEMKRSKSDTKLERKSARHFDLQKPENVKNENSSKSKQAKIDYYSVSDISQCMNSCDKTKLIGWRNKSISEESSTNNSFSVPSGASNLSNVASINSENTHSINTEECEEFIADITEKLMETNDSSHTTFMSKLFNKTFKFDKSDQSLDFKYEIDNAPVSISVTPNAISTTMTPITNLKLPEKESQTEIEVKTTVSVSKNVAELKPRPLQIPKSEVTKDDLECKRPKAVKINPLADLDISSKNLFRHDVNEDEYEECFISRREGDGEDKCSKKKAFFMRLIRRLGEFIISVRNISYKYVFRYILFI